MASSIKVAEAAKVIENSQRDINIAFVNELAKIFNLIGIDTKDVLEAASTKWNFLNFKPGLVGGHCIGVDPYYLAQKAQELGYNPEIILAGRRLNDNMGSYISNQIVKNLIRNDKKVNRCKILILGITFKENCPDIRNSKIPTITSNLEEYGINVTVLDPWANPDQVEKEFNIKLIEELNDEKYDAIVLAVPHDEFIKFDFDSKLDNNGFIYDVKSFLKRDDTIKL